MGSLTLKRVGIILYHFWKNSTLFSAKVDSGGRLRHCFQPMSIFEILMLVGFGLAWPFSIAKGLRTGSTGGKSLVFLLVVLFGYFAGITHKILYSRDPVIFFYILNAVMVAVDIAVFLRNKKREAAAAKSG